jgi:hypothetical protein
VLLKQKSEENWLCQFLAAWYGQERADTVKYEFDKRGISNKGSKLMKGVLNFTHFVYVGERPSFDNINFYFALGMAILSRLNQDLLDILIPFILATRNTRACSYS